VGEDGFYLLDCLARPTTPAVLRDLPSVKTLAVVWAQQYEHLTSVSPTDSAAGRSPVRWKELKELPRAAEQLESPYDLSAMRGGQALRAPSLKAYERLAHDTPGIAG